MKTVRTEVYIAIDEEREYQNKMTADPSRPDMIDEFHVGDGLSAIRYNLQKAEEEWYKGAVPHTRAMHYLRKVAAICVKLGEDYGMPIREKLV